MGVISVQGGMSVVFVCLFAKLRQYLFTHDHMVRVLPFAMYFAIVRACWVFYQQQTAYTEQLF